LCHNRRAVVAQTGASGNTTRFATTLPAACTNACTSGGKCANVSALDVELQAIVDAWPALSKAIQAGIMALVNAAK